MTPRDYVEYVVMDHLRSTEFDRAVNVNGDKWQSLDAFRQKFVKSIISAFKNYDAPVPPLQLLEIDQIIQSLIDLGGIQSRDVAYVGPMARLNIGAKDDFAEKILAENSVAEIMGDFDSSVIETALKNISKLPNWGFEDDINKSEIGDANSIFAPGSDRIVKITDNQSSSLIEKTDDVVDKLSKENSIDGDTDLRSRIIGQIKAGRELLFSGVVRVELLRLSLIESLIFLIKRYEKEAIGAAASVLLAELVKVFA